MSLRSALFGTYLALIGIATAMIVVARGFPAATLGPAGPGFFPQLIAVILIVLSIAGLVEALRLDGPTVNIPWRVVTAMVLSLAYVGGMYLIGFYPSTFLFCFAIMTMVRDGESILRIIFEALVLAAVSYLFFGLLLKAYLPTGILIG
ncbi:MAG: tripartite tricarboxylate transporter TctB family protein [Hyphomicrobiaceae bacterium]